MSQEKLEGKKFDTEKVDMDLLSPFALEKIAQVMTYGKKKYGTNNWRGGIVYSRLLAAVMRHLNSYRRGETLDPETGLSHIAHASCGLMMLLEFEDTRPDLDDRFFKDIKIRPATYDKKDILEFLEMTEPLPKDIEVGDLVKHLDNDQIYRVSGFYYDNKLEPNLLLKDESGFMFGDKPICYKRYEEVEIK